MLRGLIKSATATCASGTREECAAAWDQVEEVSRVRHKQRVPPPKVKETVMLPHCRLRRIGENLKRQDEKLKEQKEDLFFLWKHYKYLE